jgi:hypothetical protein
LQQAAHPQPETPSLTPLERRAAAGLAAIFAMRMLGLFMILPVFALYAHDLAGATPLLVGLAIGAYGLTQALLQIPFGLLSDRIGRKPVILRRAGAVRGRQRHRRQRGFHPGRDLRPRAAGQRGHRRRHHRAGRGPDP